MLDISPSLAAGVGVCGDSDPCAVFELLRSTPYTAAALDYAVYATTAVIYILRYYNSLRVQQSGKFCTGTAECLPLTSTAAAACIHISTYLDYTHTVCMHHIVRACSPCVYDSADSRLLCGLSDYFLPFLGLDYFELKKSETHDG